ncbi:unnamed protein product [Pedinophyceae sp. YPF-701]|nr:unnamed protein product [Pedinophyceae sp. YPF-701]
MDEFDMHKGGSAIKERSNNLYVKNLPITWDVAQLQEFFGMCGQVTECRILPISGVAPGASALVRMSAVEEAAATIEQVHGKIPPGSTMPLVVRYADTPKEKARKQLRGRGSGARLAPGFQVPGGPGAMGAVAAPHMGQGFPAPAGVVQVDPMPPNASRLWLYETFAPHGAILDVAQVPGYKQGSQTTGLVLFARLPEAVEAVIRLQGLAQAAGLTLTVSTTPAGPLTQQPVHGVPAMPIAQAGMLHRQAPLRGPGVYGPGSEGLATAGRGSEPPPLQATAKGPGPRGGMAAEQAFRQLMTGPAAASEGLQPASGAHDGDREHDSRPGDATAGVSAALDALVQQAGHLGLASESRQQASSQPDDTSK